MKNTFGEALTLTLFGESHGPGVGAVLDGIAPGVPVDEAFIAAEMDKRRAVGAISTPRQEADRVQFLSGVYEGHTTGTPLTFFIANGNVKSKDYSALLRTPRPGHADYTGSQKYNGFNDPRGGGHFSGRLTAPLVAAGALCRQVLAGHGIQLATHLARCAGIDDAPLPQDDTALQNAVQALNAKAFATLDGKAGEAMQQAILAARGGKDSVGGVLETVILGLKPGLGEPFFGSVESVLGALYFSIPAVKGVEFGLGFGFADLRGSQANDAFTLENGTVRTRTNRNGGLNGGITNGMPVVLRAVVKPTPSIAKAQQTLDLETGEETTLEMGGRHDPCILHRARAVADALAAFGLLDLLAQRKATLGQLAQGPAESPF